MDAQTFDDRFAGDYDPLDYLKSKGMAPGMTKLAQAERPNAPPQPTQNATQSPQSTGVTGNGPPPYPAPPNLKNMPNAPQADLGNPFDVFKDPAIVLAGLGSFFTRRSLTTAFNSAAGAMEGYKQGRQDVFEQKKQAFDEAIKSAVEQNKVELDKYNDAWNRRSQEVKDKFAELYAQAAGNNDPIMSAAIQSGNSDILEKIIAGRATAQAKLEEAVAVQTAKQDAAASQNDPATIDVLARRLNAGDTSALQNVGRGAQGAAMIQAIRKRQTEILEKEQGLTPDAAAKQTANATAEFGGIKAGERTLGTRTANIEMAVNEAYNMLPQAQAASDAVPRSKWVALNKLIQAGETQSSDPDMARFLAAHTAVVNTYARAISPSGTPTVADKEHAREIFSTATGPEAYKAVLTQIAKEMEAARRSPGQVREEFRSGTTGGGQPSAPQPGTTEQYQGKTYRFKGGDVNKQENWEPVQ